MKTRTGFVSNSSTSSYLLIVPIATHESVMSEFGEYEKEVIDYVSAPQKVLGQNCMVAGWVSGNGSTFDRENLPEKWDGPWEIVDYYIAEVNKRDETVFFHGEDF
jgi:hypothetical protein